MSDTALRNAQARRAALADKISQLNQSLAVLADELERVDQWIELWHKFDVLEDEQAGLDDSKQDRTAVRAHPEPVDDVDSEKPERTRTTGNPRKEDVAAAARQIIEEVGDPVPRADMLRLLAEKGIVIVGKDPEQVLSTMLWRMREKASIARVPTGGYWLAERPHSASGYLPEDRSDVLKQALSTPMNEVGRPSVDDLDEDEATARHAELSAEITEANRLYYAEDAPEITNGHYDALRRELTAIEGRFPNLTGKADEKAAPASDTGAGLSSPKDLATAAMNYLKSMGADDRKILSRYIENEREIPEGTKQALVRYYMDVSGKEYVKGSGFREIFESALESAIASDEEKTRSYAS